MVFKIDKLLPKLDVHAAPGQSVLRIAHIKMWTGVYAPPTAEEAGDHWEILIIDMANDKVPA